MLFLLDTNAASDLIKRRSIAARKRLDEASKTDRIAISVITQAEILFGLRKRPEATSLKRAFADFCDKAEILAWTEAAAASYAELRMHLRAQQRTVATMDLLIASQAHSLGAVVVTRDGAFDYLSGMVQTVSWSTDFTRKQ